MRYRQRICAVALAVGVLVRPEVEAQIAAPSSREMQITSCLVYLAKSPDKTYECTTAVAAACNGKARCEIPIGYNLTADQDVDPASGFLGKMVKITYTCGGVSMQRGPYQQNNHATMFLECSGL